MDADCHKMNTSSPLNITVSADRDTLFLSWDDGHESAYQAGELRRASRASQAVRERLDSKTSVDTDALRIADIKMVGNYAINLTFTDGHDRGIYPWSYLRELEANNADSEFIG